MLRLKSKIAAVFRFFGFSPFGELNDFLSKLKNHQSISLVRQENELYSVQTKKNEIFYLRGESHSDFNVFNQIIVQEEFRLISSYFKLNSAQELIIIDAGANIGLTSVYFNNLFKNTRLYCIEPDPENFKLLQLNCDINQGVFVLYQKALTHKKELRFHIENSFRDGMDWAKSTTENSAGDIEGITIGEIIDFNNLPYIDLLKIDIEGAERYLFSDTSDVSFLAKVKVITIEIHDEFDCRDTITKILQKWGFILMENGELTVGFNKSYLKQA